MWCVGKIFTECHAIVRPISSLAMSRRVMPSLQNLYQPQHRHRSAKHVSLKKKKVPFIWQAYNEQLARYQNGQQPLTLLALVKIQAVCFTTNKTLKIYKVFLVL